MSLIGCHLPLTSPNYLLNTLELALDYGCSCFMIYTGSPQTFNRVNLNQLKIPEFQEAIKKTNIKLDNIVVHAPYIINLATNDPNKKKFNIQILLDEIKRTIAIGSHFLVVHPGNARDLKEEEAIMEIANVINQVNKQNTKVVICLETMAGKGTEIGTNFQQLNNIINLVLDKNKIGVCIDTCHMNDAGYDMSRFDDILNEFDSTIGIKYLKVLHLNDSKNKKGAKKDRHENLGHGTIGFQNLLAIVQNPRLNNIPIILETPYYNDQPFYKEEIQMLNSGKWFDIKEEK